MTRTTEPQRRTAPPAGPSAPAAERAAAGRSARSVAPRSSHRRWEAPAGRADPVGLLEAQGAGRVPELLPIRYGRMAASELAFLRGAAAVMTADLAATPVSGLRAQLCGDAHLGNFGGFRSPERSLVFDVNDFDETLPGPWEWDVKRLAVSLEVAGRDRGLAARERRDVVGRAVCQYREAMAGFARTGSLELWYARLDRTELVPRWRAAVGKRAARDTLRRTESRAAARDSLGAFAKLTRTVDGQPRLASRPPLLVPVEELTGADAGAIEQDLVALLAAYRRTLPPDRGALLDRFQLVHLARKVVGVGSVGTRCWVALLTDRDTGEPLVLQFKEAERSVLAPHAGTSGYRHQGRRVVEGQRHIQAASDVFLGWVRARGEDGATRDYYARQLWDGKISAEVSKLDGEALAEYGRMCAWTLARAHARTGDRLAIAGYLGGTPRFDEAVAGFAAAYADQNARDRAALLAAVKAGRVRADTGT